MANEEVKNGAPNMNRTATTSNSAGSRTANRRLIMAGSRLSARMQTTRKAVSQFCS
jgi:hypothetical protein